MIKSLLWCNKIVTKNVTGTKIVEFIKNFEQYPKKLKSGYFLCFLERISENLNLRLYRLKLIHDFTSHGRLVRFLVY